MTWGGPPDALTTYVAKKDFWTGAFFKKDNAQRRWGMLLAATIIWEAPGLRNASYSADMHLWTGEVDFSFSTEALQFNRSTFVGQASTPDDVNFFVTEFGAQGASLQQVSVRLQPGNPAVPVASYKPGGSWSGVDGGVGWMGRNNTANAGPAVNPYRPGPTAPHDTFNDTKLTAGVAMRIVAADGGRDPVVNMSTAEVRDGDASRINAGFSGCGSWGHGQHPG